MKIVMEQAGQGIRVELLINDVSKAVHVLRTAADLVEKYTPPAPVEISGKALNALLLQSALAAHQGRSK